MHLWSDALLLVALDLVKVIPNFVTYLMGNSDWLHLEVRAGQSPERKPLTNSLFNSWI